MATKVTGAEAPTDRRFLTRAEAAQLLRCSVRHLERLAAEQSGPPFIRHGTKVVYRMDRLLTWADAQAGAQGVA